MNPCGEIPLGPMDLCSLVPARVFIYVPPTTLTWHVGEDRLFINVEFARNWLEVHPSFPTVTPEGVVLSGELEVMCHVLLGTEFIIVGVIHE